MAEVFLSMVAGPLGSGFSKLAVVKRLRPDLVEDPDFIAMLVDEARISARLNHPNVVQTLEVDVDDGEYFIAMEFLDGQPLHRIQRRAQRAGKPLSAAHQYVIVADTLAGLQHAHELCDYDGAPMGIVHRDVTPQNIFITYDGQVKVVDFGIAKAEGRAAETKQGIVKGKVRYMSPEQAVAGPLDCRSDVFAAGVLLWEAATGRRFWEGLDDLALLEALAGGAYDPSPRAIDPNVPEAIDAMCRTAMAFDADDRYASAADFRSDLETFLSDGAVLPRRSLGPLVADLFAKERRALREVIEETSRGNVAPMSLVTFSAANASQTWSMPSIAPAMRLSSVPPPPVAPSLAPVMLAAADTQNCLASDEELGPEETTGSRLGGYLAALALAASIALAFGGPRIASGLAQGSSGGASTPEAREAAQVVGARTDLAARAMPRGKKGAAVQAAPRRSCSGESCARAAPDGSGAGERRRDLAPPPTTSASATIGHEGSRRKPVIDAADPWSPPH